MVRPVRLSFIALSVVLMLFTMQIGVSAKKRNVKRKSKAARSVPIFVIPMAPQREPVIVTAPVLTPTVRDSSLLNMSAPSQATRQSAPTVPSARATGSGSGVGAGDNEKRPAWYRFNPAAPTAGSLVISEFRLRGPSGANDEFIEIYNDSGADHTVAAASGTGYAVAASDGTTRCSIPNGTVIPARGHYLCTNSVAYSLGGYAAGDATYALDIPDNAGIALFNNNTGGGSYSLANRFDAVGSTSEANTLYKEGTGYPALTPFSIDYAFVRDACGQQGSITNLTPCPLTSGVADTDNNAVDFYFVDTNGTSAGAGQRLGSPGPENLASPIQRNANFAVGLPDICVAGSLPPNQIRDLTSVPAQNSTFGTIELRRTVVNNTGANVTRLRFRVTQQTTFPAPSGTADLRTRTTADTTDNFSNLPCGTGTSVITVLGTTLEQPPSQPNGGAFNGTFSVGTVTLGTPIPPGNQVIVRMLWGVQQTGKFRVGLNIEVLP